MAHKTYKYVLPRLSHKACQPLVNGMGSGAKLPRSADWLCHLVPLLTSWLHPCEAGMAAGGMAAGQAGLW